VYCACVVEESIFTAIPYIVRVNDAMVTRMGAAYLLLLFLIFCWSFVVMDGRGAESVGEGRRGIEIEIDSWRLLGDIFCGVGVMSGE